MTIRRELSQIMPSDVASGYAGSSLIKALVLASSNALRQYLGLKQEDLLPGPIPRFVTRKDPSLDNYCADVILRTLYEPTNSLPPYEEHIIRDDWTILSSVSNPRLAGAVLIGIGGQSKNPDFKAVYDEHAEAGTRGADSAARVVINRHLAEAKCENARSALQPLMEELDWIDARGEAPGLHLKNLTRDLQLARFSKPGYQMKPLQPQWKRAILSTILTSVWMTTRTLKSETFKYEAATKDVLNEYNSYVKHRAKMVEKKYLPKIMDKTIDYYQRQYAGWRMRNQVWVQLREATQVHGKPSLLTPEMMITALRTIWPPKVVSFVLGFLFEAALQSQDEYYRLMDDTSIPMRKLSNGTCMIYYELQEGDMLPHRALTAKIKNAGKSGIVVAYDPFRQITAIFRAGALSDNKWKAFVRALQAREGVDRWYAIVQEDGTLSNFVLNGTSYFVGVPMTDLVEEEYAKTLEAIRD